MLRLKNIEKNQFDDYINNHKTKSHFLQSLSWGEFSKTKKNLTPYYLGLVNEKDELVAATLLLEKKLPLHMCCLYAPRGFVIDYQKKELVRTMTKRIVEFAKKKKAISLKIDPDIIKTSTNYLNETIENENAKEISETLKSVGFKHQSSSTQPQNTFRIDLNQSIEEIESHFSSTTKQRIAEAKKLDTEVVIGSKKDIPEFFHLMTLTEPKKDIIYNEDYYETLYEIFNGNEASKATLFLGKINIIKTTHALEKNLKDINSQISILPIDNLSKSSREKLNELTKQKENIIQDIEKFKKYRKDYGNEITLSAHMIIEYGDKAWVLYTANHNLLSETYVNYSTYFEHIKYCKEKGIKIYDQFETIGNLSKDDYLNEFKKGFGGDYIEFIGEWNYITNPIMYFIFTKLAHIQKNKSKIK